MRRLASWVRSSAGTRSPNLAKYSSVRSASAATTSASTANSSARSASSQVEAVEVERASARAAGRSGVVDRLGLAARPGAMTHSSTRLFSPKPGHRNVPSASLRNQFTWKIRGSLSASALARPRASGRSSRPCCSRRTAASRTGRGAARRPCPRRRRSAPTRSLAPMNTPCSQSKRLDHQRHVRRAPAAEQDRRDRHALPGPPTPARSTGTARPAR